jgi:competence protein ComEC
VDGIQLLAVTVLVMLAVHPLDLYNAGFQLSFLTVLGLMVYADRVLKRLDRRDEDERVLWSFGIGPTRVQSIRNCAKRWGLAGMGSGLVAWAVSAPLIVEHFDQLNPWAIPAGIVLGVPVFFSLVGGLLKVVLTLLLPWFAPQWAWLAAWPVEAMRGMVAWLATIPGSDVAMPAVPLVVVLVYYGLLMLPLIPTARPRLRWACRGGAGVAFASVAMMPLIVMVVPRGEGGGRLRVTLLSVGAGQCAVVEAPGGKTILIDAGSSTRTNLHRGCVEPFLRRQGVGRIDAIYVSHANADHYSAVAEAAEQYGPLEVVVTPHFRRHAAKSYSAGQMLKRLAQVKCPVREVSAGQTIDLGEGGALEMLWPPAEGRLDANESSQVMRLTFAGKAILFTGDVQAGTERALLADESKLAADVLVAPHHGSAEETTARFVEAVGPRTILASNDRTPSGKQREFDRIMEGKELLRTDRCGAITVTIGREGAIDVKTFLKR